MGLPAKNFKKPITSDSALAATKPKPSMKAYLEINEVNSWRMLMEAYKRAYSYLDSALAKDGHSCARFQIFYYLYFDGPHSASALARKQVVTRGNISMFLKRLMAEKLVTSIAAPDSQKRKLFALSKKGREEFEKVFPKHIKRIQRVLPKANSAQLEFLSDVAEHSEKAKG